MALDSRRKRYHGSKVAPCASWSPLRFGVTPQSRGRRERGTHPRLDSRRFGGGAVLPLGLPMLTGRLQQLPEWYAGWVDSPRWREAYLMARNGRHGLGVDLCSSMACAALPAIGPRRDQKRTKSNGRPRTPPDRRPPLFSDGKPDGRPAVRVGAKSACAASIPAASTFSSPAISPGCWAFSLP